MLSSLAEAIPKNGFRVNRHDLRFNRFSGITVMFYKRKVFAQYKTVMASLGCFVKEVLYVDG